MQLVAQIQQTLDSDGFALYAQPIICLAPGNDRPRYEILLRMNDGEGSSVASSALFSAAERYKLMPQIDRWVLSSTMKSLAEHRAEVDDLGAVFSINLSGQSLSDDDILQFIDDEIREDPFFLTDYTTLGIGDFAVIFQPKGKPKAAPRRKKPPTSTGGFRLFSEDATRLQGAFKSNKAWHDVLIGFETKQRTGTLKFSAGDHEGTLIFGYGVLVVAELDGASGQQVLDAILALDDGVYFFSPDITPSEDSLMLSLKQLIAAR